jgi:hypothetical protein
MGAPAVTYCDLCGGAMLRKPGPGRPRKRHDRLSDCANAPDPLRGPQLPDAGELYRIHLHVALTDPDPAARAAAGRAMRALADEVRARRPPPERGHSIPHTENPALRDAVQHALDHRICGES